MDIGIVGYGVVGHALGALFGEERLSIYDKYLRPFNGPAERARVNRCELVFLAVPTPMSPDGAADVSAVEEVASWLEAPACIKSTVPPGTTDALAAKYGRSICFSPEYVGETPWHPFKSIDAHGFVVIGGPRPAARRVLRAYQEALGPQPRYILTQAKLAEMAKYMENCFLATKVAFANQFHDLALALGLDYDELRELWLQDERVGRSHTLVTSERGFGGRCLPKDLAAMISLARAHGGAPLLEAVRDFNEQSRARAAAATASGAGLSPVAPIPASLHRPAPAATAATAPLVGAAVTENGREAPRTEAA